MPQECVIKLHQLRGDKTIPGSPRPYFFQELDRPMTDRIQELEQEAERLRLCIQERDAEIVQLKAGGASARKGEGNR